MITVTGTKINDKDYIMHAPEFPYKEQRYIGYNFTELKSKYRKLYHLEGKHIDWIVLNEIEC